MTIKRGSVKTRIIATLGPASDRPGVLRRMMRAGLDVVRINFSHGTLQDHARRITAVRALNRVHRRALKVLVDLAGFRIRVGLFHGGKTMELKRRQAVRLSNRETAADPLSGIIPFDYQGPLTDLGRGQDVFIDDGNLHLVVTGRDHRGVKAEVVVGGVLRERKGINLPGARLHFDAMTVQDREGIAWAVAQDAEFIAQSFVRSGRDMRLIREMTGTKGPRLVAKVECREAIHRLDDILDASDGVMVARGDMGVSLPIWEVPMMQKKIIRSCKEKKKFVITATQMLESMTENLRPTRAEVSDVANAVLDGTDYVMLSGETAVGKHPVETVEMMNRICGYTEREGR